MFFKGIFVYLRKIRIMSETKNKTLWDKLGNLMLLLAFFVLIWEAIKWVHKTFGIIGDLILTALMIWAIYCMPGNPGAHKFEQNHDKPMWEDHWTNKKK